MIKKVVTLEVEGVKVELRTEKCSAKLCDVHVLEPWESREPWCNKHLRQIVAVSGRMGRDAAKREHETRMALYEGREP